VEISFLGHQGWLLATAGSRVLIDPLLTEGFGHGGLLGRVWPPRELELDGFGAIDAVILSHEHDDHFDVPSLNRLARTIPIYLSSRSSRAARELLVDMGFAEVRPLRPDGLVEIGELRVRSFVADHQGGQQGDEWDVLPLLAWDLTGHGSVMSSIDVAPRVADLARLGDHARPGVWIHANNCSRAAVQDALATHAAGAAPEPDTELVAVALLRRLARLRAAWGDPIAALICGGGWSFAGERAWLNHELFPVDSERLAAALAALRPELLVRAPAPGFTVRMAGGEIVETRETAPFVRAAPRERWPAKDFRGEVVTLPDYAPATGRTRLEPEDRAALLDELVDFARYLYGTPVFCQLCSLAETLAGARAQLCLVLREAQEDLVLRYEPTACRFELERCADPLAEFASGLECWATDLLALLRGELGASALCYAGRLRQWNRAPGQLYVSPRELWVYAHPLRRPDRAARLYRRLLAAEPESVARIPAACR
jgi:hypothetical protein